MRIKKFEQLNEELGGDVLNVSPEYHKETRSILNKLEDGAAILIDRDNLDEFYKSVSYYSWINYQPELDPLSVPPKMYWVLIGRKLYTTHKPSFGGQDFEVYEPNFEK